MATIFTLFGEIAVSNDNANKAIDETVKKAEDASGSIGDSFAKIGGIAKTVGTATVTAGAAIGAAWMNAVENSRDYRTEMGKLNTAFTTNGHNATVAMQTYRDLQAVLGETDTAVEAANHLAVMTDNAKDLQTWTKICTGVFATFGDSLPIEGLTEAANETAKVGQVVGPLADALNWAGIQEDEFNKKLAARTSEQERQQLIMDTLNGTYSEAAEQYRTTSGDILAANTAQEKLTYAISEFGRIGEPIMTAIKTAIADMALAVVPHLENLVDWVGSLGDKFDALQTNISNAIDKMREFLGLNDPTGVHTTEDGVTRGGGEGQSFGEGEVTLTTSEDSEDKVQSEVSAWDLFGDALIYADPNSQSKIQGALNAMNLTVPVTAKVTGVTGIPGFATGLDRVPYDNMLAYLHKDEMVLTASEAAVYRGENRISDSRSARATRRTIANDQPITVNLTVNGVNSNPYEIAGEVRNALELMRWQA